MPKVSISRELCNQRDWISTYRCWIWKMWWKFQFAIVFESTSSKGKNFLLLEYRLDLITETKWHLQAITNKTLPNKASPKSQSVENSVTNLNVVNEAEDDEKTDHQTYKINRQANLNSCIPEVVESWTAWNFFFVTICTRKSYRGNKVPTSIEWLIHSDTDLYFVDRSFYER